VIGGAKTEELIRRIRALDQLRDMRDLRPLLVSVEQDSM
jgi:hypothetical protein